MDGATQSGGQKVDIGKSSCELQDQDGVSAFKVNANLFSHKCADRCRYFSVVWTIAFELMALGY